MVNQWGYYPAVQEWGSQAPPSYYPGDPVAGFTPMQQQSWDSGMQAADRISNAADASIGEWYDTMEYGREGNPYLDQQVQNMQDQAWQGFRRGTLPQMSLDKVNSGNFGSTRHGLAQGVATGDMARAVTDATTDMYSNAYGQQLGFQNNMLNTGNQLLQNWNKAALAPAEMQAQIGAQQQAMNQQRNTADFNRWQYDANAPQQKLAQYGQMMGAINAPPTTAPNMNNYQSPTGGMIGGAMTGAGMVGDIANWWQDQQNRNQPANSYAGTGYMSGWGR